MAFDSHPSDCEVVYSRNQRPKLDQYDDHAFIVLHFPPFGKDSDRVLTAGLDLFMGPDYPITPPDVPLPPLNAMLVPCCTGSSTRGWTRRSRCCARWDPSWVAGRRSRVSRVRQPAHATCSSGPLGLRSRTSPGGTNQQIATTTGQIARLMCTHLPKEEAEHARSKTAPHVVAEMNTRRASSPVAPRPAPRGRAPGSGGQTGRSRSAGPTYRTSGRMSRLSAACSSTWAVQPA